MGQYLEAERRSPCPLLRREPLARVAWGGGHVVVFKMKHREGTGFPNHAAITTCHVSTYHHCSQSAAWHDILVFSQLS